jgi:predicted DNA-binding transcriptional regulator AlpA
MNQRLLRLNQAAKYMGVDIQLFNAKFRNTLQPIRVTQRTILFDVKEIDELINTLKGEASCQTGLRNVESSTT